MKIWKMMNNNRELVFLNFIEILKTSLNNNSIGIEIGCYAGESTEFFVNSGLFKNFYCIDPWKNGFDTRGRTPKSTEQAEPIFDKRFKNNKIIKKIKDYSWNVVNNFQDESIDFIYIDGNHSYDAVKKDLELYYPKIKKNGIVSRHDYHLKEVKKAVDEFFKDKFTFLFFEDNSWMTYKI